MKKLILGLLAIPLVIACNQEVKKENEVLKQENAELSDKVSQQDSIISDLDLSFATIQDNLSAIRQREASIEAARDGSGLENSATAKDQVIADIETINALLDENKETINALNDKMKRYSIEVGKFKRLVAGLQADIDAKDQQITSLKEDLASMNFEMSRLNARLSYADSTNLQQKRVIAEQIGNLNTAYYAIGTFEELNENGVLTKKGGVIGIGRTKALAEDFNKDYFTKIDITKTTVIPLNPGDNEVKLISNHPTASYELAMEGERVTALRIKDQSLFWKTAKYLVVLID